MKILVVYYLVRRTDRNTIDEHLYSFARYSGQECWYLNAFFGVPSFITRIPFDLVVYHYTFTGRKWNGAEHFEADLRRLAALKGLPGYKVAVPQDEYVNTVAMCRFFRDFGIRTVFTCFPPSEYQKAYPRELSGLEHYVTVLTGYIDETSLAEVSAFCRPHRERTRDVGYRARKVPFWLGRHGLIKWRLTEVFQEAAAGTGIRADLSKIGGWSTEDALFVSGFYATSGQPKVQLFTENFFSTFGYKPSLWEANAYDSAGILQGLAAHEAPTRSSLQEGIASLRNYPGLTGTTTFGENRAVSKTIYLLTVKNGTIVEVVP